MKIPLLFLVLLVSFVSSAQKMGKFFYTKDWELTTRDSATFIRMCVYDTTTSFFAGPVTDMFLSGKTQMKGSYKAGKKEGVFTFYYEDGTVESTGSFTDDRRTGPWTFNYPNGNSRMEVDFKGFGNSVKATALYDENGKSVLKDGTGPWFEEYEEYKTPGKIIVTGQLKKFEKHGTWTCKLSNGQILYEEEYKNGDFVNGFVYDNGKKVKSSMPHGNQLIIPFKFLTTEAFDATPSMDFNTYPILDKMRRNGFTYYNPKRTAYLRKKGVAVDSLRKDGVMEEIFTAVDVPAAPPGGMASFYKFVGNEMKYPAQDRRMGIDGKVMVEYVIGKDGSLTEIKVIEGRSPTLNAEAVRVVTEYAKKYKFNPAMQRGKPVKSRMVMPITFKLG